MVAISIKDLLDAGAHFGHQTSRWNPKMKKFIFEERNGIYILDLEQTAQQVERAREFVVNLAKKGGSLLFVGTKRQAKDVIKDAAVSCNMFYVLERWLGGTLTNIDTIRKSISHLEKIEKMEEDGAIKVLSKKEVAKIRREKTKLERNLSGIRNMKKHPDAIFIVDPSKEQNAVLEAKKLRIPVIGLADTNCDPEQIDFPIACNDDAIRAIALVANLLAHAMNEGSNRYEAEDFAKEEEEQEKLIEEEKIDAPSTGQEEAVKNEEKPTKARKRSKPKSDGVSKTEDKEEKVVEGKENTEVTQITSE